MSDSHQMKVIWAISGGDPSKFQILARFVISINDDAFIIQHSSNSNYVSPTMDFSVLQQIVFSFLLLTVFYIG
jgi:hypothetical protein